MGSSVVDMVMLLVIALVNAADFDQSLGQYSTQVCWNRVISYRKRKHLRLRLKSLRSFGYSVAVVGKANGLAFVAIRRFSRNFAWELTRRETPSPTGHRPRTFKLPMTIGEGLKAMDKMVSTESSLLDGRHCILPDIHRRIRYISNINHRSHQPSTQQRHHDYYRHCQNQSVIRRSLRQSNSSCSWSPVRSSRTDRVSSPPRRPPRC